MANGTVNFISTSVHEKFLEGAKRILHACDVVVEVEKQLFVAIHILRVMNHLMKREGARESEATKICDVKFEPPGVGGWTVDNADEAAECCGVRRCDEEAEVTFDTTEGEMANNVSIPAPRWKVRIEMDGMFSKVGEVEVEQVLW